MGWCLLVLAALAMLFAADSERDRPMLAQLRMRVGHWIFIQLRAQPTLECTGRLVSVDARGFVLEQLDGRQVVYQLRTRDVLCVADLPGQDVLQAKWAEHQEAEANAVGKH